MTFTEMSEKNYEIYGISKEKPPSYEDFLFNYVFLEDQPYCERKRLEILQAEGPEKFLLEFRIIKQDTGNPPSNECLSNVWKMRRRI